jgi:ribonuclease P protein component
MVRKQAFSRACRLTERSQFVRLFDNPKVHRSQSFQAFYKEKSKEETSSRSPNPRLGITFKGRLSSVWRMRIKRVIREWFRAAKEKIGAVDLNIVIRVPQRLDMEYIDQLKRQLREWKS